MTQIDFSQLPDQEEQKLDIFEGLPDQPEPDLMDNLPDKEEPKETPDIYQTYSDVKNNIQPKRGYFERLAVGEASPVPAVGIVSDAIETVAGKVLEAPVIKDIISGIMKGGQKIGSALDLKPFLPESVQRGIESGQNTLDSIAGEVGQYIEENPSVKIAVEGIVDTLEIIPAIKGTKVAKEFAEAGIKRITKVDKQVAKEEAKKLATRITQGKKIDRDKASRGLLEVDVKDVKTFDDLKLRSQEKLDILKEAQDEVLGSDKSLYKVDDLVRKTKVGKKEVTENFVEDALEDMEKVFSETSAKKDVARIQNLREKANTEGLSNLEINNIAREYGGTFKDKTFTKLGDQKTSLQAGRFENTRKGVKETSRDLLGTDEAKLLDQRMSDLIKTNDNVEKMVEKVSDLAKRTENRSLLKRIGGAFANIVDATTGGVVTAFMRRLLIPRGGGVKLLNALDLEEDLAKNLKKFIKEAKKSGLNKEALETQKILDSIKK